MERRWWHEKTAYQIYPKSFLDTNGDGIGDLKGIISKLDYLKDLGIGILWLSPIYCSPLADQGYDISDYYNIDPRFGTMEEMDLLLAEAKKRGITVLMDLVVNHCSDEHEWFKAACADPDGKYGKYFYIRDYKEGEPLPCNWRSYFGGPVWDKLPGHDDKIYLHLFHKKQPDLNWENPEMRQDIYKMINWWLDKGLGGFRIDAIINIKKLLPFTNFPADREDGLCSINLELERAKGVLDFLDEMAENTFRKYDAFTVGEVFNEKPSELPLFIGDHGVFSSMFDFAETLINRNDTGWYTQPPVEPEQYKAAVFASQRKIEGVGMMANIIENHDEPRGVSRYIPEGDLSLTSKKMLGGLNYFLKGLPFLYQGQELGMENVAFTSIDQIDDINTIDEYNVAIEAGLSPDEAIKAVRRFSRDNARTPFHWDASKNAGFTTGTPWLGVNPNYTEINLASQLGRSGSMVEYYKSMIRIRDDARYHETLVWGETKPWLEEQKNLMAYIRDGGAQKILAACNYSPETQTMKLPGKVKTVILNNLDEYNEADGTLTMSPYQFVLLELE